MTCVVRPTHDVKKKTAANPFIHTHACKKRPVTTQAKRRDNMLPKIYKTRKKTRVGHGLKACSRDKAQDGVKAGTRRWLLLVPGLPGEHAELVLEAEC